MIKIGAPWLVLVASNMVFSALAGASEAVSDARVLGMGDSRVAYAYSPTTNPALLSLHGARTFLWDLPSFAVRIEDDARVAAFAGGDIGVRKVARDAAHAWVANTLSTPELYTGQQQFLLRGVERLSEYVRRADIQSSMAMSLPGTRLGVGLWSQTYGSAARTVVDQGGRQRATLVTETGLSLSRQFAVYGDVSFGITPKYIRAYTYDRVVAPDDHGYDTGAERIADRFNLDVGVARRYDTGWMLGGAVTNLIPMALNPAASDSFRLLPNVRFGLAFQQNRLTYAADIDFTHQINWVDGEKRRYFALGTEYAWKYLQLRTGYRHNLALQQAGAFTGGVGIQLYGFHFDAAFAANQHEFGATAQVSYRL